MSVSMEQNYPNPKKRVYPVSWLKRAENIAKQYGMTTYICHNYIDGDQVFIGTEQEWEMLKSGKPFTEVYNTNNRTAEQIVAMYDKLRDDETTLRESIRHFLSRHLMNTSEDKPMRVGLTLQGGAMGLSELEKPEVETMFQDGEGIIWVQIYGMPEPMELDDVAIDWQVELVDFFNY